MLILPKRKGSKPGRKPKIGSVFKKIDAKSMDGTSLVWLCRFRETEGQG